jgi:hypothetical protein
MRKRILIAAVGAILCAGGYAVAQNTPTFSVNADTAVLDQGRTTLSGGVTIMIDGVAVRADRAVIEGREVSLQGNVRMTLPNRFRVASQF